MDDQEKTPASDFHLGNSLRETSDRFFSLHISPLQLHLSGLSHPKEAERYGQSLGDNLTT